MTVPLALAAAAASIHTAEIAQDALLNCWAEQWPQSTVPHWGDATPAEIAKTASRAKQNCKREVGDFQIAKEIELRDQFGLSIKAARQRARHLTRKELNELFEEYWSRL